MRSWMRSWVKPRAKKPCVFLQPAHELPWWEEMEIVYTSFCVRMTTWVSCSGSRGGRSHIPGDYLRKWVPLARPTLSGNDNVLQRQCPKFLRETQRPWVRNGILEKARSWESSLNPNSALTSWVTLGKFLTSPCFICVIMKWHLPYRVVWILMA